MERARAVRWPIVVGRLARRDVGTGVTAYLKTVNAAPAVVAADRGPWRIDYGAHQNGWPRTVRIRAAARARRSTSRPSIEDLEVNTAIDGKAFTIDTPAGAAPMTLDELRSVQPLKGSD